MVDTYSKHGNHRRTTVLPDKGMSEVGEERLSRELALLDKIIYTHSNQHRKTKYFQRLKHVRGTMRKFLVSLKDPATASTTRCEKQHDILVSTAEIFTVLLGQSYFMPLAITALAILSRLVAFVTAEKDKIEMSSCHPKVYHENDGEQLGGRTGSNVDRPATHGKDSAVLGTLDTSIDALLQPGPEVELDTASLDNKRIHVSKKKHKKKKKKRKRKHDAIDDIFGF